MDEKPVVVVTIRKQMQRLPYLKLVAFSASCCEDLQECARQEFARSSVALPRSP